MHFGEYELSPSLISLSPLPSAHPEAFQRLSVRPSMWFYPNFSLAKGRSLGFASTASDYSPSSDSLSLRLQAFLTLNLAKNSNSQVHYAKGMPSLRRAPTACRHMVSGSIALLYSRFFSPFPHGTGSLSVSRSYLALADGPASFTQDFSCPALLRILLSRITNSCTGFSPSLTDRSKSFHFCYFVLYRSPTTPRLPKQAWFGLLPFRSPLLRE